MTADSPVLRLLPLLLVLGACAHRPGERTSSNWLTLRTPHVVVHGPRGKSLEQVVERLEETYAALAGTFFKDTQVGQVEAMLLEPDTFLRVMGPRKAGVFVPGVGLNGSLLVIRDFVQDWRFLSFVVAHELTHRFAKTRYPDAPLWLHEGLAMFLETMAVKEEAVTFGRSPGKTAVHFNVGGGMPLAKLIGASRQTFYGEDAGAYYSAAWSIIHYLATGRGGANREKFSAWLQRINDAGGDADLVWQAFRELYPEEEIAAIEEASASNALRTNFLKASVVYDEPMRRPEMPAISSTPGDRARVLHLLAALKPLTGAEVQDPIIETRDIGGTHVVRVDASPLSRPLPYVGGAYEYLFDSHTGFALAMGRSRDFGYEGSLAVRRYREIGLGNYVGLAVGPLFAVTGGYYFALHPEISWEFLSRWGFALRASAGLFVRITDSQSSGCQNAAGDGQFCGTIAPVHPARRPLHPVARVSLGWQF